MERSQASTRRTLWCLAGILLGVCAGSWFLHRHHLYAHADAKAVLDQVKARITADSKTVDGAWIEMQPVARERNGQTEHVLFGGVSYQTADGSQQLEFHADAKTGALLDLYPVA